MTSTPTSAPTATSNSRSALAICPHCKTALPGPMGDVGTVHTCPACKASSFIVDVKALPVALHHHLASALTVDSLPAAGSDGVIRLEGWLIDHGVQLVDAELPGSVSLLGCVIGHPPDHEAAINMRGATIAGHVMLEDVVVNGHVDMHHAQIDGNWFERSVRVNGNCEAASVKVQGETRWWEVVTTGEINFYDATFNLNCLIRSCTFHGEVNFNDVKFLGEGNFSYCRFHGGCDYGVADFGEGAEFYGVTVDGAAIFDHMSANRWVDFTASHFAGPVGFERATFRDGVEFGSVLFDEGANFVAAEFGSTVTFGRVRCNGSMEFDHAQFGGRVDFRHARLLADADFTRARFADTAYFQGTRWLGTVLFAEADCDGDLRFDDARFQLPDGDGEDGDSRARTARPAEARMQTPLDFQGLHVYGKFVLDHAHLNADLVLDRADVEDNFNAHETVFAGELSMRNAQISGALRWNNAQFSGPVRMTAARLGSGLLMRGVRGDDLWDWTDAQILGPSSFADAYFAGRNRFDNTWVRGRFDLSDATFTEKLDLSTVRFEGKLVLDGLRSEHFIITRQQVEGRLQNEVFALQGGELGEYWEVVAREYAVAKRSFAMQTLYNDMDWAHHLYSRAHRKFRTWRAINLKKVSPEKWLASGLAVARNVLEKWIVDWGSGYGTRPVRVLMFMLVVAVLFTPVYLGQPESTFVDGREGLLSLGDAFSVSLGAEFAVGVDNISLTLEGWRRFLGMFEVVLGVGLLTLFISTLSRKMVQ
ncbi:MAG: pentapeptide repeat-containing protein [Planctomycetota bacterium]